MNILFISLSDLRRTYPQRPHHLLKRLSEKHNVDVLSVNAWWLGEIHDSFLDELLKNVKFDYITNRRIHTIFQEISIINKVRLFKKINNYSYDVIVSLNDLIAYYIVSKTVKTPLIFDICDDIPQYIKNSRQIPYFLKHVAEYSSKLIMNWNIECSRKVTCTLKSLEKKYNIPAWKSVLIQNGVDTNIFRYYVSSKIESKLSLVEDNFVMGFVGFLGEWVDIELPLFALKKLLKRNFKIKMLVVGDGDRYGFAVNLANKLGISDNVIFTGSIPYLQIPKYISLMNICLLPFKKSEVSENALPLKLFEYMACERAVISTPLLGVKEAVGNRVIYASDVDELVQIITELYRNDESLCELGKEGRNFVEENYGWDKLCGKFEKVLFEASGK